MISIFFIVSLLMVSLIAFIICKDASPTERKKIVIAIVVAILYGGICCLLGCRPPGLSFGRFI